jgi:deazaflavin-dependent oxidoreductase (nitroreductase family)
MTNAENYAPSPVAFVADHVERYLRSGGADGFEMQGIECIVLTTKGRKSGALRRSPVVRVKDGERYLVVGSRGGAPEHPQWYFNLVADPDVTIHDGDQVHRLRARVATGAEREALWAKCVAAYGEYAVYQTRTDRQIPVVVCEPPS